MARIRTIKPELFASMSAKGISVGARWLFAGLLCEADDEGRMIASPRKIAGNIFPDDEHITEDRVEEWLNELEHADGMIVRYRVAGIRYLWIPKFNVHQRVSHPTPSRLPPPPPTVGLVSDSQPVLMLSAGPPEKLAKSSGEPPEGLRKELEGELNWNWNLNSKREGEGAPAPPTAPSPVEPDRSRQNPNAPPPRPHSQHTRINGRGAGFMENPADFPKTIEELLMRHGTELSAEFPMLDGKSPRPSIETAVRSKFRYYVSTRDGANGGHANAMATLRVYLGDIAKQHSYSWQKDGAPQKAPKVRNKDAYEECIVLAEKAHTDCPPNPDEHHDEWVTWCKNHQDLVSRAKKNVLNRGTKAAS